VAVAAVVVEVADLSAHAAVSGPDCIDSNGTAVNQEQDASGMPLCHILGGLCMAVMCNTPTGMYMSLHGHTMSPSAPALFDWLLI
jgi:hypothetical protein